MHQFKKKKNRISYRAELVFKFTVSKRIHIRAEIPLQKETCRPPKEVRAERLTLCYLWKQK